MKEILEKPTDDQLREQIIEKDYSLNVPLILFIICPILFFFKIYERATFILFILSGFYLTWSILSIHSSKIRLEIRNGKH